MKSGKYSNVRFKYENIQNSHSVVCAAFIFWECWRMWINTEVNHCMPGRALSWARSTCLKAQHFLVQNDQKLSPCEDSDSPSSPFFSGIWLFSGILLLRALSQTGFPGERGPWLQVKSPLWVSLCSHVFLWHLAEGPILLNHTLLFVSLGMVHLGFRRGISQVQNESLIHDHRLFIFWRQLMKIFHGSSLKE